MARARNIKPAFFDNEKLGELNPLARLLFIGLWCIADRRGRLEDRPKRIKKEVLGYDDCNCDELLQDLHKSGFIYRYIVEQERYIQVINFEKHQNPHKKEAESIIPAPEITCISNDLGTSLQQPRTELAPTQDSTSPADSLLLIPDSLIPDSPLPESGEKPVPVNEGQNKPITKPKKQADQDIPKVKYADLVAMTNDEYSSLLQKLDQDETAVKRCIEILDNYKGSTGKKYVSDYRAILNWVIDRYTEEQQKKKIIKIDRKNDANKDYSIGSKNIKKLFEEAL